MSSPRRIKLLATLARLPSHRDKPQSGSVIWIHQEQQRGLQEEMIPYWAGAGEFTTPEKICDHLIDDLASDGTITREHAQIFKKALDDSFQPDKTTGYYAKHRLPLIHALKGLYLLTHHDKTVFHIEGDIGNLGGLNKAMEDTAQELYENHRGKFDELAAKYKIDGDNQPQKLGRLMADRVLGAICRIVKTELSREARIVSIRKGGDEIEFLAEPLRERTVEEFDRTVLKRAQGDVAKFVKAAGLELIPHLKKRASGVSIGLHAVSLREESLPDQMQLLDEGITKSKKTEIDEQAKRLKGVALVTHPNIHQIEVILDVGKAMAHSPYSSTVRMEAVPGNASHAHETPNSARKHALEADLLKHGQLNSREQILLDTVHELSRQVDGVTHLPMFDNMQWELLPVFLAHQGSAKHGGAKLMHIDFSNMAGGNALASALGDTMGKAYAECLHKALKHVGREDLLPYAAAIPGGKFALLVPADLSSETLETFSKTLRDEMQKMSQEPLVFPKRDNTMDIVRSTLRKSAPLREKYGSKGERLFEDDTILMKNIMNPKTRLKGVSVTVAVSPEAIHPEKSLDDQMTPLRAETDRLYKQEVERLQQEAGISPEAPPGVVSGIQPLEGRIGGGLKSSRRPRG